MPKQSIILLSTAWLIVLNSPLQAEQIFKCKSSTGVLIYGSAPCADNTEAVHSWNFKHKPRPPNELLLQQNQFGHYETDGSINGQRVDFLIDTGATKVSLPSALAQAANLNCIGQVEIHTANGKSLACAVSIKTFKFGPFSLENVDAIIAPNLNQPLLGMNVLQQYKIAQNTGEMRITAQQ